MDGRGMCTVPMLRMWNIQDGKPMIFLSILFVAVISNKDCGKDDINDVKSNNCS